MNDAPYKLSRGALRERYGSRAIDGSAPTANPRKTIVTKATEWAAKFPKSKWAASVLNPVDTTATASSPLTGFWAQKAAQYAAPIGPTQPAEPVAGVEQYQAPIGPVASISDMAKPPGYAARWQQAAVRKVGQGRMSQTKTGAEIVSPFGKASVSRAPKTLAWGGYR